MDTLVALDLETTGLDPQRDAIIEIGAVRFRGDHSGEEWSTLVNPGRPIPPFVQQLTGISDEMVSKAPRLSQVLGDLESFVGLAPIVGHNLAFDLSFLQRKGLFRFNQILDTLDLASVLLPSASRYSLRALVGQLNIPVEEAGLHRALADAQATRMVFQRLARLVEELPFPLIEEIARLGEEIEWGAGPLFDEALQKRGEDSGAVGQAWKAPFLPPSESPQPLIPSQEITPLDALEVAAIAEPRGALSQHFPHYENRPQQVTMMQYVTEALSKSKHLLVEAGTGIGKSLAYLIPAFLWASQNGRRVVISTNTINLQDQLIHKDIPDLQEALQADYRAAILKGKANYLCPRRLEAWRRMGPQSAGEMRLLAKVLVWLYQGGTGDRGEINLGSREEAAGWTRLSADSPQCVLETCQAQCGGACPYYKAHMAAEKAHVIIVNHALLLSDISAGSRVIPEYDYLIVDEAHHLESATTQALSIDVSEGELQRLLRDILDPHMGLIFRVGRLLREELRPEARKPAHKRLEALAEDARQSKEHTTDFFTQVAAFLERRRDGAPIGLYDQQQRIEAGTRTTPDWTGVEIAWEALRHSLSRLAERLRELASGMLELAEVGSPAAEDLSIALRTTGRDLETIEENLESIVLEPQPGGIYWAEAAAPSGYPSLHVAPLEIGPLVEQHLWFKKESVIMTSATLTAEGEFDYIRHRLNAYDAEELALGSPFDFESSTLLYLVTDIPDPNSGEGYQRLLERGLRDLCLATQGRALVLFTSHAHMRRTTSAIAAPLEGSGIRVIEQLAGAPRHTLLETFRTTDKAVLLGTRSFWEGVDVPGPALSVLAIARLPFSVPSDPIVAARAEMYESPFDQYFVPEAVLRFRQGFGRLIRTKSDRGVCVSFDHRILSKRYGRSFISSLPRCTVREAPLADLPAAAARWLGD
jgi:ATP-dependent DNA helicase DinG